MWLLRGLLQLQFPLGKMCSTGKLFDRKKSSLGTIFVGENSRWEKLRKYPDQFGTIPRRNFPDKEPYA